LKTNTTGSTFLVSNSLDQTLIWAFGRIKFKVCIETKAARYGIKLYVITDAATAFVLK
jgi:hypothetical protein